MVAEPFICAHQAERLTDLQPVKLWSHGLPGSGMLKYDEVRAWGPHRPCVAPWWYTIQVATVKRAEVSRV